MNSAVLRRAVAVAVVATALFASVATGTASGAAIVLHPDDIPDCVFEPGDVPGVNVFFPAECTVVFTPSGNITVVARGELPAGYSLSETFVGTAPCFGVPNAAHIVATTSGEVTATCHL